MALKESHVLQRYFDRIAPSYELLNSLLSLNLDKLWRRSLMQECRRVNARHVLDVACGTGDVTRLLQKNLPQAQVVGLDVSHGMLAEAIKRDRGAGFVRADGVRTPFADATFDLITISFGFRNMPTHEGFLSEANRILKPGGRLLILELTQPQNPILRLGNTLYLNTVLPAISSMFGRDREAYAYLRDSILGFPDQAAVCEKILKAGFAKTDYQLLTFGVTTLFTAQRS